MGSEGQGAPKAPSLKFKRMLAQRFANLLDHVQQLFALIATTDRNPTQNADKHRHE